jgi:glycosyltransferase involved in cell wall biosynthesis
MKLIIQIPCFNEEKTLPQTIADLPRHVDGFDSVEYLVINDGSQDKTVDVAIACGVDYIVDFPKNQGLAKAFLAGLQASVYLGADVIVNTDADNQYCGSDIPKLIEPILSEKYDIVIGARPISNIAEFSKRKKLLQKLGSYVVRLVSGTDIPDAPSGFRALTRAAALELNVFGDYTYTIETIIQAGHKGMLVTSVPIQVNPKSRDSRLVKSLSSYIYKSALTILRVFLLYKPLKSFLFLGTIPFSIGFSLGVRWLILYFLESPRSHVPSLILSAILILVGTQIYILGLLADLLAKNRLILEGILIRSKLDHPILDKRKIIYAKNKETN